jgi:hypothetical protein
MEAHMPRQKNSTVPTLPPLGPFQRASLEVQPLVDALADRVIATLCGIGEPFTVEEAQTFLYHRLIQTTHKPDPRDEEDAATGNRMSACEDAALMIGFALGRRIGGAR